MYFRVRGSNIHETVIFNVIFRTLEVSCGRWATMFFFSDMCSFNKIDFSNSLTVGLSSNLDIWFITFYFVV